MADTKKDMLTKDSTKHDVEASPTMDGAISATASIATVGAAAGAAIGLVGGPAGIIAGAAIGGSMGAMAGAQATISANHSEEVANEENVHPAHVSKPVPKTK